MTVLTLLAGLALAGSNPVAVLLPSDTPPESEKDLEAHLQEVLKVENLKLEKAESVEHPKAILTALMEHPTECQTTLKDSQNAELDALLEKAEDVYLVYPASTKPKGAIVWRYQAKKGVVARQDTGGGPATLIKPATAPGKLALLAGKNGRQNGDTVKATMEFLGVETVDVVKTDEEDGLRTQLLEHPNKCMPEIAEGVPERFEGRTKDLEGYLMVAVVPDDGSKVHVWRWDAEAKMLYSNAVPQPE